MLGFSTIMLLGGVRDAKRSKEQIGYDEWKMTCVALENWAALDIGNFTLAAADTGGTLLLFCTCY